MREYQKNPVNRRFLINREGYRQLLSISAGALLFVFTFLVMARIMQVRAYAATEKNIDTLYDFQQGLREGGSTESNPIVLNLRQDITIDAGQATNTTGYYEITGSGKLIVEAQFNVNCSLKLTNGGTILCMNGGLFQVENGGTFEISGGVFNHDSSRQDRSIYVRNGIFKISGGVFNIPADVNTTPIMVASTGKVMITGGTINKLGYASLISNDSREITMSGGTVNLAMDPISNNGRTIFTMSGGTINYEGVSCAVKTEGFTMSGGTINNKSTGVGVDLLSGNNVISGNAEINNTSTGVGVGLSTGAILTMNGGNISSVAGGDAVYIHGTGTFTKNSGTVTGKVEMNGIECCTVSFNENGGSGSMPVQYVPKNTDTALIENKFTHATKSFYRWKDRDANDYYKNKGTVNFGADKTLVAQWADRHTITVTDDGNGTGSTDIDEAAKEETITVTATPDSNHVFKEWTSADGVTFDDATSATTTFTMLDKNVTVKANFKEKTTPVTECTVSFNANGGKGTMADQSIPKGTPTGLSKCGFTYDDHTFAGWARTKNGEVEYADGEEVTIDIDSLTLYAKWTDKPGPKPGKCTITFDANGGKGEMKPQSGDKGEKIKLRANDFKRSGYEFKNWNTKADGSGDKYDNKQSIELKGDMTLYAQWKEKDDEDDDDVHESKPSSSNNNNTKAPDGCDELRAKLSASISEAIASGKEKTVTWDKGTSLPYDVMKMLQDNPMVTLVFSYTYLGQNYTVTIPGSAVVANPAVQWYGPIYLYALYGNNKAALQPSQIPSAKGTYTIKPGDSLSAIAKRLKTTVKHLKDVNNIKDVDKIKPGMVLKY